MEIGAVDSFNPFMPLDGKNLGINPFAPSEENQDTNPVLPTFSKPEELIEAFKLDDPQNRLSLIGFLDKAQQKEALQMLTPEALVLGMQFYEQDKILDLLYNTDQSAIFQVFEGIMPLEKMIAMIDEDVLNNFLLSDKLDKEMFVKAFNKMEDKDLVKIMESLTGSPQENTDPKLILASLCAIPEENIKPIMLTILPEQKGSLIAQLLDENNELSELFPKNKLMLPLEEMGKEKTLKGIENLDTEVVSKMIEELPEELMPLLLVLVEPEQLATEMLKKYDNVLTKAMSAGSFAF